MSFKVTMRERLDREYRGPSGDVLDSSERVRGRQSKQIKSQDSSLSGVGELIEPVESHEPKSRLGTEISLYLI
jgi:hypothetical protein